MCVRPASQLQDLTLRHLEMIAEQSEATAQAIDPEAMEGRANAATPGPWYTGCRARTCRKEKQ